MGLSQREVVTLAAIVQKETANAAEAPTVAGLYRTVEKMLLQTDPTLKPPSAIGPSNVYSMRIKKWTHHLQHLPKPWPAAEDYSHSESAYIEGDH